MKPHVFISSTYYDLKYVRESLEKLLLNLNFEPVLFEANKVTFEHGKPLDISCFNEVKTCHIMILIIGGRYGSIISDQDSEHEKEIYDKEYTSITKKEYETALKENIPTFIFIDKNVFGEYNTYKINREFYNDPVKSKGFKFANIDSLHVFKFIDLVSTKAIKAFERIEEIESYLKDQISGMFYLYLESLKSKDKQNEIFDAVVELKNLTSNMNTMVKEVAKATIGPEKYQEIIEEQYFVLLKFFFDKFQNIMLCSITDLDEEKTNRLVELFRNDFFTEEIYNHCDYLSFKHTEPNIDYFDNISNQIALFNNKIAEITNGIAIKDLWIVVDYFEKIKPLITSDEQQKLFESALKNAILNSVDAF